MEKDPYLSHLFFQIKTPKVRYSQKTIEKIKDILKLLSTTKINHEFLQNYSLQGFPDECNGLRSLCWKILLGYLPDWPAKWGSTLETSRKKYNKLANEYNLSGRGKRNKLKKGDPNDKLDSQKQTNENILNSKDTDMEPNSNKLGKEDHPQVKKPGLTSDAADDKMWNEIAKDTRRTRSGMDFFQKSPDVHFEDKENVHKVEDEKHIDVLTRILYIYGKNHPDVSYTQGMNELLAPIYYCFANDQNPAFKGHAEADSYYCFSALMEELKESFIQKFTDKDVGIQARIQAMDNLLKKVDKELWDYLNKYGVQSYFYSLRWLMLLLTQEFELTEVLRLWDTLFGNSNKLEYLNYICVAMIEELKDRLMETDDFCVLMTILQRENPQDLDEILSDAYKIHKKQTTPQEVPAIVFIV